MITQVLLSLFTAIVSFFDSLLPSVTVPSWFTADAFSGVATTVGDLLSAVKNVLPVVAMFNVLHALLVFLPLALGYVVFDWCWKHSPTIAGCSV